MQYVTTMPHAAGNLISFERKMDGIAYGNESHIEQLFHESF